MNIKYLFFIISVCLVTMVSLGACQQEGLLLNSNDISYINFSKDMTKDTTKVCFEFYPMQEGMDVKIAEVPLDVIVSGKVQEDDLDFTIGIDERLSTFPVSKCILPEICTIKKGNFKGVVQVKLQNYSELKTEKKILALKINSGDKVSEGIVAYSRALLLITDQLVKPDWWDYKDLYDGEASSVDWYYLGEYSKTKYRLFLDVLRENDDMLFDGKDKAKLRKYSLQLKYKVKKINDQGGENTPLKDEFGRLIEIPVVG